MMEWIIYALLGVVSGVLSGLLGLGGGLVIVPILFLLFSWQGMAVDKVMHVAIATSLTTIVITSLGSIYSHHRLQTINWNIVKRLFLPLIVGSVCGAALSLHLPTRILQSLFSVYALCVAFSLWSSQASTPSQQFVKRMMIVPIGLGIGIVSALLGIGGGSLTVPYLLKAQNTMRTSIGTAAACGLPISMAAVISFIVFGSATGLNTSINWQAFMGITSTSIVFSALGAKLAQDIAVKHLKRLFSGVLAGVAIAFLF